MFHYVDDFIIVGDANSSSCSQGLSTLLQTFAGVGTPVEPDKCEGPASCLIVLGIEIDTTLTQLCLLKDGWLS